CARTYWGDYYAYNRFDVW
nr:immunoglobulin heavy chain junction region [Macaca mulatta]